MHLASTVIATLPIAVWVNDTFFKICRVNGKSMEPTLYDGDIVIVRTSDGFWQRWTRNISITVSTRQTEDVDEFDQFGGNDDDNDDTRWDYERRKVLAYEGEYCNANPIPNLFLRHPPVPVTGDIVVFKDPSTYFPKSAWNIKRVIGLGGQTVLVPSDRDYDDDIEDNVSSTQSSSSSETEKATSMRNRRQGQRLRSLDEYRTGMTIATTAVPPYSLWVEGDNKPISRDSRRRDSKNADGGHGPVSKKLLVGIAEYRVWPPWRIGKLSKQAPLSDQGDGDPEGVARDGGQRHKLRAFWPY